MAQAVVYIGSVGVDATPSIGDFVDNVCQAKHLLCEPFPIDFKRASKSIPVFSATQASSNVNHDRDTTHVLATLRKLFPHPADTSSADPPVKSQKTRFALTNRWTPPVSSDSSASTDANDYQHQVLGDLGYLKPSLKPSSYSIPPRRRLPRRRSLLPATSFAFLRKASSAADGSKTSSLTTGAIRI